jgi:aspartate carbamoyltransferase regulatory subunit
MTGTIEATIYVVWDEDGTVASHVEADEAAQLLEQLSTGHFRRAAAVKVTLPSAEPIELAVAVPDDHRSPSGKVA